LIEGLLTPDLLLLERVKAHLLLEADLLGTALSGLVRQVHRVPLWLLQRLEPVVVRPLFGKGADRAHLVDAPEVGRVHRLVHLLSGVSHG